MRHTIAAACAAGLLAFAAAGCSSYSVEDCQRAITSESTKTDRPKECEDLSQEDYDTVLMNWAVKNALNEMDPLHRDALDYYDDGSINGSLTDD